ncbi:MAG: helix-turn-helix transcriptional regulator [Prevotellaceae bacterium]|nr:helix-turn-helix transcriptional regulator [Prevotellaceae bacterium]
MTVGEVMGRRIRFLCKERNISISQLAEMSGLPHSTIDNIVNGRSNNPGLKTLVFLANALSMTPPELIDFPELIDYLKDGEPDHPASLE